MSRLNVVVIAMISGALTTANLSGQSAKAVQPPAIVVRGLQAKFPGITPARWTAASGGDFVGAFQASGAQVAVQISASGAWVSTATEIGAIKLPDSVQHFIVHAYKGYRFAETRRVDRAIAPLRLFEVRLERGTETTTLQFEPNGKVFRTTATKAPAVPVLSVAGTWRGESLCLPGHPACHDETVVYRVSAVPTDTAGFDVRAAKVVNGQEEEMGTLPCTLDRRRAALVCLTPQGVWQFESRRDSLIGGLTLADSTRVRAVRVRKVP